MLRKFINDGDVFDDSLGQMFGFNSSKDYRLINKKDSSGNPLDEYEKRVCFVGFIVDNDKMLISLPKKYICKSKKDFKIIFNTIRNFKMKSSDIQVGPKKSQEYESNYPFQAFYNIYEYYLLNGLHVEWNKTLKKGIDGKVDWKKTIDNSSKFIIGGDVLFFPFYSSVKYHFNDFITYAMINAINVTVRLFSDFLDVKPIDGISYDYNIFKNNKYVCDVLEVLKEKTYNEKNIKLITNLISFYRKIKSGKKFYFKHYNFSSIWECAVRKYLSSHYSSYDEINGFKAGSTPLTFEKKSFYPNKANSKNSISIDGYAEYDKTQLIIDAKYYDDITTINYKQVAYSLFLKEMNLGGKKIYDKTYSILVLPSDKKYRKTHFEFVDSYSIFNKDIIVYSEYLNIHDLIEFFNK